MDSSKLKIIQQLMSELADDMEYSPDDFGHRLGRKKPEEGMIIMKSEDKDMPEDGDDMAGMMADKMMGKDSGDEMPDEDESPENSFKKRLMNLRG